MSEYPEEKMHSITLKEKGVGWADFARDRSAGVWYFDEKDEIIWLRMENSPSHTTISKRDIGVEREIYDHIVSGGTKSKMVVYFEGRCTIVGYRVGRCNDRFVFTNGKIPARVHNAIEKCKQQFRLDKEKESIELKGIDMFGVF